MKKILYITLICLLSAYNNTSYPAKNKRVHFKDDNSRSSFCYGFTCFQEGLKKPSRKKNNAADDDCNACLLDCGFSWFSAWIMGATTHSKTTSRSTNARSK